MSEKPIENEEFKPKTITKEGESLTDTKVIFDTTEGIKPKTTAYEQFFTLTITDKRRCVKLEKASYPFYRINPKTKKSELFYGFKIFHGQEVGSDIMTQEVDVYASEDAQYGYGISIVKSELKEITDKSRLREILKHCEGNWSFYEGILSQGSTKNLG